MENTHHRMQGHPHIKPSVQGLDRLVEKVMLQTCAKCWDPNWLGFGASLPEEVTQGALCAPSPRWGAQGAARQASVLFQHRPPGCCPCWGLCVPLPPPSHQFAISNLLWAGRPDNSRALKDLVLQLAKCLPSAYSELSHSDPSQSLGEDRPGPSG